MDDRPCDALAAYLASLVHGTEAYPTGTITHTNNDVNADISGIVENFFLIVRGQRKSRALIDADFTDIYHLMSSLPKELHPHNGQLRAFGVQYSQETRFTWMKEDIAETSVLMHVYQRVRQDYVDVKSLLEASVVDPPATRPTQEQMAHLETLLIHAQTQLMRALDTLTQSAMSRTSSSLYASSVRY